MSSQACPFVSILIPVKDEQGYISQCLDSICRNDYPYDRLEVLVIDGCSTDNTIVEVNGFLSRLKNLKLLSNKHETVPFALNKGIKTAKGDVLMWLCGHAVYCNDYISTCIELLSETGAASVGGLVIPKGRGRVGRAIAGALTSPLGNGNAIYRSGANPGWVDTVMGGCWLRSSVEQVGGFEEGWTRNQDSKFNTRLKEAVGGIYFNPSIWCYHYVRESLWELAVQYFEYGFWRFKTIMAHPGSIKLRQLAAPTLLLGLCFSLLISSRLFVLAVFSYLLILLLGAVLNKHPMSIRERLLMPAVFTVIHFSWGAGFLCSLASSMIGRFRQPESSQVDHS